MGKHVWVLISLHTRLRDQLHQACMQVFFYLIGRLEIAFIIKVSCRAPPMASLESQETENTHVQFWLKRRGQQPARANVSVQLETDRLSLELAEPPAQCTPTRFQNIPHQSPHVKATGSGLAAVAVVLMLHQCYLN